MVGKGPSLFARLNSCRRSAGFLGSPRLQQYRRSLDGRQVFLIGDCRLPIAGLLIALTSYSYSGVVAVPRLFSVVARVSRALSCHAFLAADNRLRRTTTPPQPFLPSYAPSPPSSTPTADWMWDPAHRNPLDKPAYKTGSTRAQQTPSQGYWIDGRRVRHYGNSPPPAPSPSP